MKLKNDVKNNIQSSLTDLCMELSGSFKKNCKGDKSFSKCCLCEQPAKLNCVYGTYRLFNKNGNL